MRRNNAAFVVGKQVSSATKLPSIFWKPALLVFNYMTLGSTGLVRCDFGCNGVQSSSDSVIALENS